tara:strand:+ start:35 stop:535 length:501 start_codon:yes stop_codon:yes gene_type:complete
MARVLKPLVIDAGQVRQLASGETLDAVVSAKEVVTITGVSGVSIQAGSLVYIDSSGTLNLANASAAASSYPIGFVRGAADGSSGPWTAASLEVQTDGAYVGSSSIWTAILGASTLSPGTKYYAHASNAGDITATAPSGSGHYVVPIGRAISTTTMYIEIGEPIKLA